MGSGGWSDLAHQILSVTAECLDAGTIGAPKDMFVGHALPAADCCDQLVVWLTAATPAGISVQCGQPGQLRFNVRLLRPCQPGLSGTGEFPAPAAMEEAADALLVDAKVLWCCVPEQLRETLDNPSVTAISLTPEPTQGLCAGWTLSLRIDDDDCCTQ